MVLFLVSPTLFLLFPILFRDLSVISALGRPLLIGSRYGSFSFGVISALIFHCASSLDFVCVGVCQLIFLKDLLIGLLYVGTRL